MKLNRVFPKIKDRVYFAQGMGAVGGMIQAVQTLLGASWFVALGKMFDIVSNFFRKFMPYIFFAGFAFSLLNWIIGTINFAIAENKNLEKTANFIYTTLNFIFYIATGAAFFLAGAAVGMPMLLISMFIDPVVNLTKSIYYLTHAMIAMTANIKLKKDYFLERARNHGIVGLGSLFVSSAFTALMLLTFPIVWVPIIIGIAGIAAIASLAVFVWHIASNPKMFIETNDVELESRPFLLSGKREYPKLSKEQAGYYDYVYTTRPVSLSELSREIDDHLLKINGELDNSNNHFFARLQAGRRQDKKQALTLFKAIIADLKVAPVPDEAKEEENPLHLAGYSFNYKDKNELRLLIKHLILKEYPGAFQSFFKQIGKVEDCFNKLILCMMTNNMTIENETRPNNVI